MKKIVLWGFSVPKNKNIKSEDLEVLNDLLLKHRHKNQQLLFVGASVELERFISDIELNNSCCINGEIITYLTKEFTPILISLLASLWNGYYCSRILLLSAEKSFAEEVAHQFDKYNKLRNFDKCLKSINKGLSLNKATLLELGHDGICFFVHSVHGIESTGTLCKIDGITQDRISLEP